MGSEMCIRDRRYRGAFALTVSGVDEQTARTLIDSQIALPATARAEYWQATDDVTELSAEQQLRGTDQSIDTCLFIEVLRKEDLIPCQQEIAAMVSAPVMTYALLTELAN